jgi:hypothetical protein
MQYTSAATATPTYFNIRLYLSVCLYSLVGIATGYGMHGPEIESQLKARFSEPVQTGPGAHPAFCTMGPGSLPGTKNGRGVTLTPHPVLVSWSWMSRAIPLLSLWAARPVQSLSACTRVHCTDLYYIYANISVTASLKTFTCSAENFCNPT